MAEEDYILELLEEKAILNPIKSGNTIRLLEDEIYRVILKTRKTVSRKKTEKVEEVVCLREKVFIPVDKYPTHNFVGKIIGPKGETLKYLQDTTNSKISILGKGSVRNKEDETKMLNCNESRYSHLKEPLHVRVTVFGYKEEAKKRLSHAVDVINEYMDPTNYRIWSKKGNPHVSDANTITSLGNRAPIIRVGIPPPGAIALSGTTVSASQPSKSEPYSYDMSYNGTYEGYPSTADALHFEFPDQSSTGSKRKTETFDDQSQKKSKNDFDEFSNY